MSRPFLNSRNASVSIIDFPPLTIFTASFWVFPARTPLQKQPRTRLFTYCHGQKLTSLNMNEQPREDENTERCVKDSHASWCEITRPMFWKLLAEWPVLGQPDQFTKVLSVRFLRPRLGPGCRLFFVLSGTHLHAAGGTKIHARRIERETARQLRHLFTHTLLHSAVTDMLEHISDPAAHLLHLRFPQT